MNLKKIIIFPVILFLILFTVGMLLSNVIETENPKSVPLPAPENCSVWYDGCNRCTIMINSDGIENFACTEMACSEYEKPMCLEQNPWWKYPPTLSSRYYNPQYWVGY